MTNIKFSASGPLCRGYNAQEQYAFSLLPSTTTTGSGGTATTLRDMNVLTAIGQVVDSVFTVALSGVSPSFVNLTDGTHAGYSHVCNVAVNDGPAVWVADGDAVLQATDPLYGTSLLKYPVGRNTSGTSTVFQSFISASLAYAVTNPVDAALVGLSCNAGTVDAFSSNNLHSAAVRNSSLWCKSLVDLSGIPIGRLSGGSYTAQFNGVLISPRHVLCANHVALTAGDTLYFLGTDSAIHSATVSSRQEVGSTDLCVALLSSALANCTPMQVFPAATFSPSGACYLPAAGVDQIYQNFTYVPLLHFNQNQEVLLLDLPTWGNSSNDATYIACVESNRQAWSKSPKSGVVGVYSGDSGSPVFTIPPTGTTPVLIGTCHTTAGLPNVANNVAAVNAVMASLGGGYSLTQLSLSSFTTY
jgi:hypothetical protein